MNEKLIEEIAQLALKIEQLARESKQSDIAELARQITSKLHGFNR